MRALVLGATGTMGRAVSAELVRNSDLDGLVVASRSIERAEWAAQSLGGTSRGIRSEAIDVRDEDAARRAFDSSGCDVIVSCAGPAQETERPGVLAAGQASIPGASLCDDPLVTEELWALRDESAAGGIPVVSGCGLSPGITNLLVTLATAEIDEVEEIDISLALSSSDLRGDASAQQFLVGLDRQAPRGAQKSSPCRHATLSCARYRPAPGWSKKRSWTSRAWRRPPARRGPASGGVSLFWPSGPYAGRPSCCPPAARAGRRHASMSGEPWPGGLIRPPWRAST